MFIISRTAARRTIRSRRTSTYTWTRLVHMVRRDVFNPQYGCLVIIGQKHPTRGGCRLILPRRRFGVETPRDGDAPLHDASRESPARCNRHARARVKYKRTERIVRSRIDSFRSRRARYQDMCDHSTTAVASSRLGRSVALERRRRRTCLHAKNHKDRIKKGALLK